MGRIANGVWNPNPIEIRVSMLRRPSSILTLIALTTVVIGAPAAALHRSSPVGRALGRSYSLCGHLGIDTQNAINDLERFRLSVTKTAFPSAPNQLHELLQLALADRATPAIQRQSPIFNALRLQCGWVGNDREVHESIVLQLFAHRVGVDWTTAVPIHEIASQIAKQPTAVRFVTLNGRVNLSRVFTWVATLPPGNAATAAVAPHLSYFASLHGTLVANGELPNEAVVTAPGPPGVGMPPVPAVVGTRAGS